MFSLLHPCTIILVSFLGYDSRVMNKPIIPFKTSTSVLRTQRMTVISTQLVRIIHLHTTVPVTNITKETVPTVHPSTNVCTLIWMIVIRMQLAHKTVFRTPANVMDCCMETELIVMVSLIFRGSIAHAWILCPFSIISSVTRTSDHYLCPCILMYSWLNREVSEKLGGVDIRNNNQGGVHSKQILGVELF